MLQTLRALVLPCGFLTCSVAPAASAPAQDARRVRLAYFVPDDRQPAAHYERKIRVIMSIVRELYRDDLRDKGYRTEGLRFEGGNDRPLVHLVRGGREASYYGNAPAYDADEQWRRLLPEVREKVGDPRRHVIVLFAETYGAGPAEHLWPGAIARGAYHTADGGLAVFSAHLLRDEFCAPTVEAQRRLFFDETPVRGRRAWGNRMNSPRGEFVEDGVGAVAHELGHALGLPHDRRDDVHYVMGNGFRNLRWNFADRPGRRVRFSDDDARLLMSSRYVAEDLDPGDDRPPRVEVSKPEREAGGWAVSVKASDDTGLRAIVFVDRAAGSIVGGRKLTGRKQEFRQRLSPLGRAADVAKLQVIVTDDGGNQTRKTAEPSAAE